MENCIFCQIVKGESPSHKVWEDENFYAFLSIFPNTKGITLVIPKKHYQSDVFELPADVRQGLIEAAGQVQRKIKGAFKDVGRVGLVFEGFGVDHVHAKLYPLHGTNIPEWKPILFESDKVFEEYEGYISTHEVARADDAELAEIAEKIRRAEG